MKFLIIDDHAIVRKGLSQLLKEEFPAAVIEEAGDSADVYTKVRSGIWDVILLDISMPGRSGMDILKQLRSEGIKAPVLMLSMHPEDQYALRALKAGASGFLNKDAANDELIAAIHKVLAGRKYISAALAEKLAEGATGSDPLLTKISPTAKCRYCSCWLRAKQYRKWQRTFR